VALKRIEKLGITMQSACPALDQTCSDDLTDLFHRALLTVFDALTPSFVNSVWAALQFKQGPIAVVGAWVTQLELSANDASIELRDTFDDRQVRTSERLRRPSGAIDVATTMAVGVSKFVNCHNDGESFRIDAEETGNESDNHPVDVNLRSPKEIRP